jgi:hypothetical protein
LPIHIPKECAQATQNAFIAHSARTKFGDEYRRKRLAGVFAQQQKMVAMHLDAVRHRGYDRELQIRLRTKRIDPAHFPLDCRIRRLSAHVWWKEN